MVVARHVYYLDFRHATLMASLALEVQVYVRLGVDLLALWVTPAGARRSDHRASCAEVAWSLRSEPGNRAIQVAIYVLDSSAACSGSHAKMCRMLFGHGLRLREMEAAEVGRL